MKKPSPMGSATDIIVTIVLLMIGLALFLKYGTTL